MSNTAENLINLGRKLFAELLDFAYEHKFKELVLDTPKNTERAHKFYEKAGFNKVSAGRLINKI